MSRIFVRWFVPAGALCLALFCSPHIALAQGKGEPEKVKIVTVDGVELRGSFYQSEKKNAPTVLVLHALGEKSSLKGWTQLAEALQPNFSVMLFDFRGHGESTTVDPALFWKFAPNVSLAGKSNAGKDTIDYQKFDKTGAFHLTLINDIAAIRGYLDRRNDTGGCNTSSLILIGAETGATLGSIWLTSEWYRHKWQMGVLDARPEGKDVIAAIWLSINPNLGKRTFTIAQLTEYAAKQKATPMVLMYGEADEKGKTRATTFETLIKKGLPKGSHANQFSGAFKVEKTKLTGSSLLGLQSIGLDKKISDYLGKIVDVKGNEWSDHDYRRSQYVWQLGPGQVIPAKPPGEMNPAYDSYEKFVR
jgi:hypothetical protein